MVIHRVFLSQIVIIIVMSCCFGVRRTKKKL